jgi:hypothetical protein
MKLPLLLLLLVLPAAAQEAKKKTEPKIWMCTKGDLLWEEKFEGGAYSKEWNRYKGTFAVQDGALKSTEVAEDNHHPAISRKISESNVIIQASFKFDGSPWMGLSLDDKEHVARFMLAPDAFRLVKMEGIGSTTKGTDVDVTKMKLDDKAWHTVVWELYGDEMVATIDDAQMAIAKAQGMTATRSRLELISGGQSAWFKEIKVWKAVQDEKWPTKRAQLMKALKKK